MVLAPEKTLVDVEDRLGELQTEDVSRIDIEQLIDSINGQLYFFERLNISENYSDYTESKSHFLVELLQDTYPIKGVESIWILVLESVEEIEKSSTLNKRYHLLLGLLR